MKVGETLRGDYYNQTFNWKKLLHLQIVSGAQNNEQNGEEKEKGIPELQVAFVLVAFPVLCAQVFHLHLLLVRGRKCTGTFDTLVFEKATFLEVGYEWFPAMP